MKKASVFVDRQAQQSMEVWYERFASRLPYPTRSIRVETDFGWTEVIDTLPESNQDPVLLLHGAMSGAPFALGEILDLPGRRRFLAVNVMGQSSRADQVRLDFRQDEHGAWLEQMLDQLGLDQVVLSGVSWGGSVSLHMARACPKRIVGLVLVVPGSLVAGSVWQAFRKVGLPMLRYKLRPTPANARKAFAHLLTSEDELWSPYLAEAFACYRPEMKLPPLLSDEQAARIQCPVSILACEHDVYFPGEAMLERAGKIFDQFVHGELIPGANHTPSFENSERRNFVLRYERALAAIESVQDADVSLA